MTNFINEVRSITGNGNYVNLQKLAWKNSWNHFEETHFLAVFWHLENSAFVLIFIASNLELFSRWKTPWTNSINDRPLCTTTTSIRSPLPLPMIFFKRYSSDQSSVSFRKENSAFVLIHTHSFFQFGTFLQMKNEPKRFESDEEKHSDPLTSSITLKRTSKVGRKKAARRRRRRQRRSEQLGTLTPRRGSATHLLS